MMASVAFPPLAHSSEAQTWSDTSVHYPAFPCSQGVTKRPHQEAEA